MQNGKCGKKSYEKYRPYEKSPSLARMKDIVYIVQKYPHKTPTGHKTNPINKPTESRRCTINYLDTY